MKRKVDGLKLKLEEIFNIQILTTNIFFWWWGEGGGNL